MGEPKIFCFVNSNQTGLLLVDALAENGAFLAQHASSSKDWAKHDIGINSDWKHDLYRAHYPEGFQLVWVDDPKTHPELQAAYQKHLATSGEATP